MTKLIEFFRDIIISKSDEKDDFADFFLRASSKEKKKLFKRVIRKANEDQKKYIESYKKIHTKNI